jgi:hypothetical protein
MLLFGLEAVCWALWKVRNKMAIEKVMIKSPRVLIFNIISLMQQWKEMLPEREKEWVANAMCRLKRRMCRTRGVN